MIRRLAILYAWLASWPLTWRYYRRAKLLSQDVPLPLLLQYDWIDDQWWRERIDAIERGMDGTDG